MLAAGLLLPSAPTVLTITVLMPLTVLGIEWVGVGYDTEVQSLLRQVLAHLMMLHPSLQVAFRRRCFHEILRPCHQIVGHTLKAKSRELSITQSPAVQFLDEMTRNEGHLSLMGLFDLVHHLVVVFVAQDFFCKDIGLDQAPAVDVSCSVIDFARVQPA